MARLARIVLNGTRTDEELDPITVDLVLNEDNRVVQKFPTSGWWGTMKPGDELEPFVFLPTGKLDFGTDWDDQADRYAYSNILTKRLNVGEYVTVTSMDVEHCFVVKQIFWLNELPIVHSVASTSA